MLTVCLLSMNEVAAENVLSVGEVNVPQGGQAQMEIGCSFDTEFTAFELQIALPEGLSLLTDEFGYPVIEKAFDSNHVLTGNLLPSNGNYKITCRSMENLSMPTSGALFSVTVKADASLAVGTVLTGSITACEFTRTADSMGENLDGTAFDVNITEFRTLLDENSTTAPEAATDADVLLKRSIKANEWSTICLPFTASGEQVKQAWGEDVKLASFTGWESEEDADGTIVAINVMFSSASADEGIAANTPMLIKVSRATETATFDGVSIEPEEAPVVQVGRKASERGYFYGTYAMTTVPEENLFLSGNKFWYSTGATSIKGYRGYFELRDVLDAYYDASEVKVNVIIDDEITGIRTIDHSSLTIDHYYNLAGQRVGRNYKGVVVTKGKKFVK